MKTVSCIMLTRGRQEFAQRALECFKSQTYKWRELIICDDETDLSFAQPPSEPGLRLFYFKNDCRSIAAKRNHACMIAQGDLVCHWDDDDWSAQGRIADQIERMDEFAVSVTGYHSMLFHEPATGRVGKYIGDRGYALGTSLMYTREWWVNHTFQSVPATPNVGEDNMFVSQARMANKLMSVDAGQMMVARAHTGNTSKKDMNKFSVVPVEALPKGFLL